MRVLSAFAEKGKHRQRLVARLLLHLFVVERTAVEPRRRTGFQPRHIERQFAKACRQCIRRCIADAAAGLFCFTDQNTAAEERANGKNNRVAQNTSAGFGDNTGNLLTLDDEIVDGIFEQFEIRLSANDFADSRTVKFSIGLRARGPHRRTFRSIQRAKLDTGPIDRFGHRAAECVDLFGQVTFANTADGRVTAHLTECGNLLRHQQCARTRPCGCQAGFRTGVAAANHDDIVVLRH